MNKVSKDRPKIRAHKICFIHDMILIGDLQDTRCNSSMNIL